MTHTQKHTQKAIPVAALVVDPENPRFFHLRTIHGRGNLTQEQLLEEIGKDKELKALTKSIRKVGITDPIWVKPLAGGKYLVIEGNRRTCILKNLCERSVEPPKGVRYDVVTANVVPKMATSQELLVLKISLQTGKKPWGAFNEAAATDELSRVHLMANEDIADRSLISVREVKSRLENFERFQEYAQATGHHEPRRFTYFSGIPETVRKWVYESEENKAAYFKLISPDPETGTQRLRTVATKGGVRDFGKILPYPHILAAYLKDEEMVVEDALNMVKEQDIWKKFGWLKGARKLAGQLSLLDDDDLEEIKSEKKAVTTIKRVYKSIERILEKIDVDAAK
jgi:hypothetical protein